MKTSKLFIVLLALLLPAVASAYDFMADGLAYNINDDGNSVTVTYTEHNSASNYSGLTTADIPAKVTHSEKTYTVTAIEYMAFANCSGLTSVTIPNTVTTITDYAFYGCTNLMSVTIPSSVTYIGYGALACCTGLTSITIPNSVTEIGIAAFAYCTGLTSVTIPNSVTSIGSSAFQGCSGLTSVTIGNSVTTIGDYAFSDCTSLTNITIPESVASVGTNAFNWTPWFDNQPDGLIYTGSVAYKYKGTMPSNTSITLRQGTTAIAYMCFYYCSGLTDVTIPSTVTSIGDYAFYYCYNVKDVTIPDAVTSIGYSAFYYCNSAFTNLTIPKSVTRIGKCAFASCYNLSTISVESGNTVYDSRNNCNAIIETATNTLVSGCKNTVIPQTITAIGDCAFYGCAFLTSITIPESVTTIGDDAFYGCTYLTDVSIPRSVTAIGKNTFSSCRNLSSMSVESGNTVYDSRNNCNAIIETATNTLVSGCKNTVIPQSVTAIGDYAFYSCRQLVNVVIPESVTSIGQSAFYNCTDLMNVTIPNSVQYFGNGAFYYCTGLSTVKSYIQKPGEVTYDKSYYNDPYTFANVNKTYCKLLVPKGTAGLYQATSPWSEFENIEEFEDALPGDLNGDGNVNTGDVSTLYGVILGNNNDGYKTTIYVKAAQAPYLYVWNDNGAQLNGSWPGTLMSQTKTVDGVGYYMQGFDEAPINIIFNNGSGSQTGDIMDISGKAFFEYNGAKMATRLEVGINADLNGDGNVNTGDVSALYRIILGQ